MTRWRRLCGVLARRSRDISVLWGLIGAGLAMAVLPMLARSPGSDAVLDRTLLTVGVLFIVFGGGLLARAYRDAGASERSKLDADSIRLESRKERA